MLAYTGDTRPFQPFRNICAWGGALDLLIHEATLEHLLMSDAIIKKNSSITEAIQDGRSMGGKFTILAHFSPRYSKSKIPPLGECEIVGNSNMGSVAVQDASAVCHGWDTLDCWSRPCQLQYTT